MKIKANRNFISSSLSIFFPCTILGVKCVSQPNKDKKDFGNSAASFPDIVRGHSVTSKVGLVFPSLFPFKLKEIYL